MASQRFCLRWNNHQTNLLSVFDQLLHAETFTDVTLAIDGQYLKAHKVKLQVLMTFFLILISQLFYYININTTKQSYYIIIIIIDCQI
jgi:hypothetical protein